MQKQISQLEELLGQPIKKDEPLAQYTTYKIGGNAKYFFMAQDNEDLVSCLSFARRLKIPAFILAGGSNLLISDQGYNGLIILNKANDIIFTGNNNVVADAGTNLLELINQTASKGLTGLENLAGIPGSVGGAIRGNAGAYKSEIADHLLGVEVMRGSKQFILNKDQCEFKYRDSIFKRKSDLIITAEFKLEKGNAEVLKNKVSDILDKRKQGQPLEYPSAGCVFKNITIDSSNIDIVNQIKNLPSEYLEYNKLPAAWLIEQAGLKGEKIGDAQVSDKHANFIVNLGKAKANDVKQLIELIKNKVETKYNLELNEEIGWLGF